MSESGRTAILLPLLALGVALWLAVQFWLMGSNTIWLPRATLLAGVAGLLIPVFFRIRGRMSDIVLALRNPSPRQRFVIAIILTLAAFGYLYMTAVQMDRPFHPRFHDEFVYLLQARMMSVGRLWMPALPMPDFFDTFYVFVEPVYAPLAWPGAAMLFVPGMWLSLPYWVIPLLASSATVGLTYRVFAEFLDGISGLIGALALLTLPVFRMQSMQSQAQIPILLAALLLVWAWLRWRRNPSAANALLIGVIAGWAAVTRPLDAICLVIPVGIAMLRPWLRSSPRAKLVTAGALVLGAAPFLALQLVFDRGVTGSALHTPYMFYNDREQPMARVGFPKYDPNLPLHSKLLQKHLHYSEFVLPGAKIHSPSRIPFRVVDQLVRSFFYNVPHPVLLIVVPAALLETFRRQRYVLWSPLIPFVLLYSVYTLFLAHYTLLVAATVIFLMLLGLRAIEQNVRFLSGGATLAAAAICVSMLPQFVRHPGEDLSTTPTIEFSLRILPRLVQTPAVVMFKFHPGLNYHEEPVYNIDTAWPDDAPLIRVHNLGPVKNLELLEYYARRQPERRFYSVDRRDLSIQYLGQAGQLWEQVLASRRAAATTKSATTATQPAGGHAP
jgi:hypothetical protein